MKIIEKFQTIFLVAGIGFFVLSLVAMGVAPWTILKSVKPTPGVKPYTDLEAMGRQVYIHEGCWHCHTQFVRPIANEDIRYGPVSSNAEYVYEIPQLFGTRRIGPDLAREAGKHTNDWHYAHLYNPRYTRPWSVMPAFPWLFHKKDGKIVPTEKGKALVAYLQTLGRSKLPEMRAQDSAYMASFEPGSPPMKTLPLLMRGEELFKRECIGCHGEKGDGMGKAGQFLTPPPQNLTTVNPTPEYVFKILHTGMPGSAMPYFRLYSEQDLWAIAFYVNSLYREPQIPETAPPKTLALLETGKQKFQTLCTTCHGPQGRGDGPAGKALKPPPANLLELRPSVVHIFKVLSEGIPGTGMVAFNQLSNNEKWAIAYYIQELIKKTPRIPSGQVGITTGVPSVSSLTPPAPSAELLKRGQQLFNSTCFTCHGIEGNGKGPASAGLNPPPANFTDQKWKFGGRVEDIFNTISKGSPGTAMAPFTQIPEQDRWALAYYVKSFSDKKLRSMLK